MYIQAEAYHCAQMVPFPAAQKFCIEGSDENECFVDKFASRYS